MARKSKMDEKGWLMRERDAAWQRGYAKGMLVERMKRKGMLAKADEKGWLLAKLKMVSAESYAEGFKVGKAAGSRDASIYIKLRMDHADCQSIMDEVMRETGMGKRKRPYVKPVLRNKAPAPVKAGRRPRKAPKARPW
jgi:hypothetical protein